MEKIVIPKTLDEAVKNLMDNISEDERNGVKNGDITLGHMHMGIGRWMRNNWGLWTDSDLKMYFNSMGVWHPDDMSGIILEKLIATIKNEVFNLEEKLIFYEKYWDNNEN